MGERPDNPGKSVMFETWAGDILNRQIVLALLCEALLLVVLHLDTIRLPFLLIDEDNYYGRSVPSCEYQEG
jgi:hypothetical protein